jgi:hypothetical protein
VIARSEQGPRCPHCTRINPASLLHDAPAGTFGMVCIHCLVRFDFWIEKLPFYCTDDGRPTRCDCAVCTPKATPAGEAPPGDQAGGE